MKSFSRDTYATIFGSYCLVVMGTVGLIHGTTITPAALYGCAIGLLLGMSALKLTCLIYQKYHRKPLRSDQLAILIERSDANIVELYDALTRIETSSVRHQQSIQEAIEDYRASKKSFPASPVESSSPQESSGSTADPVPPTR